MQLLNHYSVLILAALLAGGGCFLVVRRGRKPRELLLLAGTIVLITTTWFWLRPVSNPAAVLPGKPSVLEVQSPYCLACLAAKPVVDRLERTLSGSLLVRRVDVQSSEGQALAKAYNIEFTPTFIFFDAAGREQWHSIGQIDIARVRDSLQTASSPAPNL